MASLSTIFLLSQDETLDQEIDHLLTETPDYSKCELIVIYPNQWEDFLNLQNQNSLLVIDYSSLTEALFPVIFSDINLPVITLTENQEQGVKSLEAGADDYIEKFKLTSSVLEKSISLTFKYFHQQKEREQQITFYQQLINGLPQSIYTKDLEGKITFVNQAVLDTLDMNLPEVIGKTVYDFYPLELAQKYDQDDRIVIETGQTLDLIENHQDPNTQDIKQVQVVKSPLRNKKGDIIGTQGIFWDVSDRYETEQNLYYRLCLESAIAEISQLLMTHQLGQVEKVLKKIGTVTHSSCAYLVKFSEQRQFATMTHEWCAAGIKPDKPQFQNVDLSPFVWWCETLKNHENVIIADVQKLPNIAQTEKSYLQSVGVNSALTIPIFDHQGELWGQLGLDTSNGYFKRWSDEDVYLLQVVGDMLYRHHQKLKEIKQKFHQNRRLKLLSSLTLKIRKFWEIDEILQAMVQEIRRTFQADRVIVYRFDSQGYGKVVNECVIAGIPSLFNVQIMDQCAWELCRQKYREGYLQLCQDTEQEDYAYCYAELLKQHQIRAQVVLPIIVNQSDRKLKVWGLLCVQMCRHPRQWKTQEIELLRQLRDQLGIALLQAQFREQEIVQKQELTRSNEELEQFAYIASHDLRQPLQIVSDFAKLLQRRYTDELDEKAHQYIHYIVSGAKTMERQIEDLLEYSRVGRKERIFELTPIKRLIEQAIAYLQKEIEQTHAQILINEEIPTLKVDKIQIIQLFQNLIDNAIKYRRNIEPQIQIKAELMGNYWLFSVKDNGIGIETMYFKRIFQIFQRLHTQEEYSGTGIGLAICQRIIKRHKGDIWLESSLEEGTTFYFTLPI